MVPHVLEEGLLRELVDGLIREGAELAPTPGDVSADVKAGGSPLQFLFFSFCYHIFFLCIILPFSADLDGGQGEAGRHPLSSSSSFSEAIKPVDLESLVVEAQDPLTVPLHLLPRHEDVVNSRLLIRLEHAMA